MGLGEVEQTGKIMDGDERKEKEDIPSLPPSTDITTATNDASEDHNAPSLSPSPSPSPSPAPSRDAVTAATSTAMVPKQPSADDAVGFGSIEIKNGTFGWDDSTTVLHNVNLTVPKGSLTIIVGPVGCGKTSLALSMLNELRRHSGSVVCKGSVSFVAQSAWILNTTLRDNILFSHSPDIDYYNHVLSVCALEHDLELLPNGDLTEIGERGINLSGGQKQRVSIARAVYSGSDIIILDDPLSALDSEVARRVFEDCIVEDLVGRTRVMVTNQLHFLDKADQIVVLDTRVEEDGQSVGYVKEVGSYQQLLDQGLDFAALMAKHHNVDGSEGESDVENVEEKENGVTDPTSPAKAKGKAPDDAVVATEEKKKKKKGKLMTVEERAQGAVKFDVYKKYITAGSHGKLMFALLIFVSLLTQATMLGSGLWVSHWSKKSSDDDSSDPEPGKAYYIGIYAAIGIGFGICTFFRLYVIALLGIGSSKSLHSNLLTSILTAKSTFFDTTPIGRIIARFSKDLDQVDNMLGGSINFCLHTMLTVLTVLLLICIITPFFTFILPFLFVTYFYIMNFYRESSRELKRLDSVTRSPVYAHFSATLGGLSTIRAYDVGERFKTLNAEAIDRNHRASFMLKMGDRWLALRLELLGILIVTGAVLFAVLNRGDIDPGLAGLTLSWAMNVTGMLGWTVRSFANLENHMNSVERILHYSDNIDHEGKREIEGKPESKQWPGTGRIVMKSLHVKYRPELEVVLKGIDAEILPGEKVGVVGRTGSGKSTLMLSLLRLIETHQGKIIIDGEDISEIGLKQLRSLLSIIPQDPVLFSGSVRFNLDPEESIPDHLLWNVLEKIQMRDHVDGMEGKLDADVAEFGGNFSAGQRQLICLARAVLRKSRILLLDEATSSIDIETDRVVQELLREEFADATVLTIAHRLNTIIDNDRILVLADGRVEEFAHPHILLSNPRSVFTSMVEQTGEQSAARLRQVAQSVYKGQKEAEKEKEKKERERETENERKDDESDDGDAVEDTVDPSHVRVSSMDGPSIE